MSNLKIRRIPLTQGLFALVDGKNYERLNRYKWYAWKGERTYYAARMVQQNGKLTIIYMHREILGLYCGDGKETDHINHCGLDNREKNIRVCTHQQNAYNRKIPSTNKSGYKGICWNKQSKKWQAQIGNNGIQLYLGCFNKKKDAIRARRRKALELFGEFA